MTPLSVLSEGRARRRRRNVRRIMLGTFVFGVVLLAICLLRADDADSRPIRCHEGPAKRECLERAYRFQRAGVPNCDTGRCRRTVRARRDAVVEPYRGWLRSVRRCEWDPVQRWQTNTGNGFAGAYQFLQSSWLEVGGHLTPSEAYPAEQSYRAVRLRLRYGTAPWPVCG